MEYLNLKRRCELERQIADMVFKDNGASCHFDYQLMPDGEHVVLTLITCNPKHQEIFTLYSTDPQENEIKCLDQAFVYLSQMKSKQSDLLVYGVQWRKAGGEGETHTSYFYAKNLKEVTDKFYENKDPAEFLIVSVHLSPSS